MAAIHLLIGRDHSGFLWESGFSGGWSERSDHTGNRTGSSLRGGLGGGLAAKPACQHGYCHPQAGFSGCNGRNL